MKLLRIVADIIGYNRNRKYDEIENILNCFYKPKSKTNLKLYDYQKRLVNTLDKNNKIIATKFRQGGFTNVTLSWLIHHCLDKKGQVAFFISPNRDICNIINKTLERRGCQYSLKNNLFEFDNDSKILVQNDNVNNRGIAQFVDYLIFDECAFIPNMKQIYTSVVPLLKPDTKTLLISTIQNQSNYFQHMYNQALCEKNDFKIFFSNYYEHPDYSNESWSLKTRKALGEINWKQEFLQTI